MRPPVHPTEPIASWLAIIWVTPSADSYGVKTNTRFPRPSLEAHRSLSPVSHQKDGAMAELGLAGESGLIGFLRGIGVTQAQREARLVCILKG
nr:hypothetical protein GCM10010200_083130 [Actinomadura rugatobispora]